MIDDNCISPEWTDLRDYFQIRPLATVNFQRAYFSSIARDLRGYSRYNEKDDLPRATGLFGEAGDNGFEGSTPGGFGFPALSARLYELGDYKFENAVKRIQSDFFALDSNWDIFGVKLPTIPFIISVIFFHNLQFMFYMGSRKGKSFGAPRSYSGYARLRTTIFAPNDYVRTSRSEHESCVFAPPL